MRQHQTDCELRDTSNEAYQLYEAEKNRTGAVTGALEGNSDVDVASLLSSGDDFIGSGSCPADRSFSFTRGLTLVIPYSTLCPWFQMLGNAMVAIASFVAARIITRRD